jgi:adenine deaminase
MTDLIKDSFAVDKFTEKLYQYADIQSQVGERERAIIVSKAARVIQVLTRHCMAYDIGIPAQQIVNIINERTE